MERWKYGFFDFFLIFFDLICFVLFCLYCSRFVFMFFFFNLDSSIPKEGNNQLPHVPFFHSFPLSPSLSHPPSPHTHFSLSLSLFSLSLSASKISFEQKQRISIQRNCMNPFNVFINLILLPPPLLLVLVRITLKMWISVLLLS